MPMPLQMFFRFVKSLCQKYSSIRLKLDFRNFYGLLDLPPLGMLFFAASRVRAIESDCVEVGLV